MENLLERNVQKTANTAAVGYVNVIIALMVVILVAVTAVIPAVDTAITAGNFTGTTATILNMVPWMLALVIILLIVGIVR